MGSARGAVQRSDLQRDEVGVQEKLEHLHAQGLVEGPPQGVRLRGLAAALDLSVRALCGAGGRRMG